jgi:sporulation protein YlmC with PRC-barrel domain
MPSDRAFGETARHPARTCAQVRIRLNRFPNQVPPMNMQATNLVCAIAAVVAVTAASPAVAQNADESQNGRKNATQNAPQDTRSQKKADKTWEKSHLAGKMIGTDVQNPKGEKIGTVKDFVLDDPNSGRISRVVVAVGGVGGVGGKEFAVPYDAFQRPPDKDVLVLKQDSDLAHVFSTDSAAAQSASGDQSGQAPASNGSQASGEPTPASQQAAK